jgi:hypothetical protein
MFLVVIGTQHPALRNLFLDAFQAEWRVYHIAYRLALLTGIYVVKYEHIRIIDGTSVPLALFGFKEVMKPHLVSAHVRSIALVISTWVLFVVLIINSSFTWPTVRL